MTTIKILKGDITKLNVDVIVNAARPSLLGGGGVDGAIHAAAGPELRQYCERFPEKQPGIRCYTGDVKITPGFNLPAKFIFHTVGPVFSDCKSLESENKPYLLQQCYTRCMDFAETLQFKSIAFPAISCGVYRCPIDVGMYLAFNALKSGSWDVDEVIFVLFTDLDYDVAKEIGKCYGAGVIE